MNYIKKIKDEELGMVGKQKEDKVCLEALIDFTDWFVTCTLKDPSTRKIVLEVNQHKHFNQSCKKNGPKCKYNFPRFPCLKTIISIPSRIKYKGNEELEKNELEKSRTILKKVKAVLEDDDFMNEAMKVRNEEIEQYIFHEDIVQNIDLVLGERELVDPYPKLNTEKVLNAYKKYAQDDTDDLDDVPNEKLVDLKTYHNNCKYAIPMLEIKIERLNYVLIKAAIHSGSGGTSQKQIEEDFKIRNKIYEEALSLSSKGYSVWIERDIDEININNYNPEWIKSWNANMDLQPCEDYFAVITYVTDYYMKDESGTVGLMKEVLQNSKDESLRNKMQLVKNAFLTGRQAGESEVYYKLLPQLHLSQSNIGAVFLPTGFKKNRSRFLKEISKEAKNNYKEELVIEVEGKVGKYYIEKIALMDKWLCRPLCLEKMSYSHFGKMYEHIQANKIPKG